MRYLASLDMYEVKYADLVRISPVDLLRLINLNSLNVEEQNDMYFRGVDFRGDLDDDTYRNISVLQHYYHLSARSLLLAKRASHLRRLGRTDSKWIYLKKRILHSNGGRPFGAKSQLSAEDKERILLNYENYSLLIKKFIERDWYHEFCEFHKELRRLGLSSLDDLGIKWKYYKLRYQWKLDNGFIKKNDDYEKKLLEKSLKYDL